MARLQDFSNVTPSSSSDKLLIVQSAGQGLATLDTVGQQIANNTSVSQLNTTRKTLTGAVNEVNGKFGELPTEIRCGIANYSGLKGGGHANRVNVPITFSTPLSGTQYAVFIVISEAYADYPYVQGYCFAGSRTANGFTATILSMSSDTTKVINGSFYWVAVRYK